MKKNAIITAILLLAGLCGFSQNKINLVIFSEDGDQFFAYVNGVKQNDKPESNVKIANLASPNVSLRIEFNDKALPTLKQNMVLENGYEHTAKIKRDMKKQLKLRYFGQVPIADAPVAGVTTVEYHSAENAPQAEPMSGNNTITSTTTTTQTYSGTDNGNGNISINMGGAGISMNVSGMDPNATQVKTTTSTTVTSSSHSSSHSTNTTRHGEKQAVSQAPANDKPQASAKASCSTPMAAADFNKLKTSVEDKPFSDTKMSTAKVATKNACLSVNQVKTLCQLFNMDDEKLAYAKYAYDFCTDKGNYYQVSEVFSFSGTTEDFNKFLEEK